MPITKTQERTLNRLERKLSKKEAHHRDFFTDRNDILTLAREGVIDQDHARILMDRAEQAYKSAKEALKPKRVGGTPIGVYLRPKAPVQGPSVTALYKDARSIVGNVLGLVLLFFFALAIF